MVPEPVLWSLRNRGFSMETCTDPENHKCPYTNNNLPSEIMDGSGMATCVYRLKQGCFGCIYELYIMQKLCTESSNCFGQSPTDQNPKFHDLSICIKIFLLIIYFSSAVELQFL
mgnify:CR=1 FL=1